MSTVENHAVDERRRTADALCRLVDRINATELGRDVVSAFQRQIAGHERLPDEIRWGPVEAMVREVGEIWRRSVFESVRPRPADLQLIEASARERAAEGMPLEDILRAYRLGLRCIWRAMRSVSVPGEERLLLIAAEATLAFGDIVTAAVTTAYLSEQAAPTAERERTARELVAALDEDRLLTTGQTAMAEGYGLRLGGPYVPFAAALRGAGESTAPVNGPSALAERLRAGGVLALSEGTRVVGVGATPAGLDDAFDQHVATVVVGPATRPGNLASAIRALRAALASSVAEGRTGRLPLTDFAPDILLAVAPELADALAERMVGALSPVLRATIETLVDEDFDRNATARRLGIHRNTVLQRIARIGETTGVDLTGIRGQVMAYLAVRRRLPAHAGACSHVGTPRLVPT
jgi:hypothetical protein